MTKLTKCLLMIAIAGLVTGGMVDFSEALNRTRYLWPCSPAGAAFLELFIISLLLEKAMAEVDKKKKPERWRLVQNAHITITT